jgi:hypothetical protein
VRAAAFRNRRPRGATMAKVSWNKTWSGKMRKKMKKHKGKNRSMKKKR